VQVGGGETGNPAGCCTSPAGRQDRSRRGLRGQYGLPQWFSQYLNWRSVANGFQPWHASAAMGIFRMTVMALAIGVGACSGTQGGPTEWERYHEYPVGAALGSGSTWEPACSDIEMVMAKLHTPDRYWDRQRAAKAMQDVLQEQGIVQTYADHVDATGGTRQILTVSVSDSMLLHRATGDVVFRLSSEVVAQYDFAILRITSSSDRSSFRPIVVDRLSRRQLYRDVPQEWMRVVSWLVWTPRERWPIECVSLRAVPEEPPETVPADVPPG
jgi:hypothetical protein